jgi:uncharacterized membrane protein YgdD (TMEM256/DUF423 family)
MGSMNAGWFSLEWDANALFPLLGVGAGLVVVGFARSSLTRRLHEAGWLGRAARYLLVVAPVLLILNAVVEFAIFGTLALAFGLISLAVVVLRQRLFHPGDRLLIALSAIGQHHLEHRDALGLPSRWCGACVGDPLGTAPESPRWRTTELLSGPGQPPRRWLDRRARTR